MDKDTIIIFLAVLAAMLGLYVIRLRISYHKLHHSLKTERDASSMLISLFKEFWES